MRILVTIALLALAVAAYGQQQPKATPPASESPARQEEAAVLKAEHEWRSASTRTDEDALNTIWMPDYTFGNANGIERSRQQCLDFLKETATSVKNANAGTFAKGHNVGKPSVRVHGGTAVVTGDRELGRRYSGMEGLVRFHYIEVWVKDNGRWRLLANQLTPVKMGWSNARPRQQ